MHRQLSYFGVMSAFLFVAGTLSAQVMGHITGMVVDQSGAALPGASINLYLSGGGKPVLTASATSYGIFDLTGLRAETYDVVFDAPGFRKKTLQKIKVDAGRETSLATIQLQVGSVNESVEVIASASGVQTTTSEISTTVTNQQVRLLPSLNRSPLGLVATQAGVTYNRKTNTVINGQRASYANVTLDGININDNYLRGNTLDFNPNQLLLDQVGEITVATSNSGPAAGGGATQVIFVTPSGTNSFHGATYWYNRNNVMAANDWFNNRDKIAKPSLNQNQMGGRLGGRILKDKLFFYTNYEAFRRKQQTPVNRTILAADARNGIFTYKDSTGAVRQTNVLQAAGVQMDPVMKDLLDQVPGADKINNSRLGDGRNTGGYGFNLRYNRTRDNVTGKLDYYFSENHVITGTYSWNHDILDRPQAGIANDYSRIPKVKNFNSANFMSAAWRWSPGPGFTNELRGGFNFAPTLFLTDETFGKFLLSNTLFDNPVNTFQNQSRYVNTYNYADNASYLRGKHNLEFGIQVQRAGVESVDSAGSVPAYTINTGTGAYTGLTQKDLPGVGSTDLNTANRLLATLAGWVESSSQTLNVTGRTSGYVAGAPYLRHFRSDNWSGYIHDTWRLDPRHLALKLGLRYDIFPAVDERDALYLVPELINNDPIQTLLSNATLNFAGKAVGRPLYATDKNNFAPNVGLVWDPSGKGRTSIRAGYSVHYVYDENIRALDTSAGTNSGLSFPASQNKLNAVVAAGLPALPVPAFRVPRTWADNQLNDYATAGGLPDPHLRTPYVQEWTLNVQHSLGKLILEARYVGNHATKSYRAFDYNQVVIKENGFLDDFRRAQSNGFLALAATGSFNPAYNSGIMGSQQLAIFPQLYSGGYFTSATIRNYIQTGQPGDLADYYQTRRMNGPIAFYRNPNLQGANYLTNYSNSTYNAAQFEVRKNMGDLQFQANYTFSKALSDAAGTDQSRFEPFMDINNAKLEKSRSPFDLTHVAKVNGFYRLPLGRNHKVNAPGLGRVLTGWSMSGILTWQSGIPLSILSTRATLNRSGSRSAQNTADTNLNKDALDGLLGVRMTGNGPYYIAASAINPMDGRGFAPDGQPGFAGQSFFQPQAGTLGVLQRRILSGPATINLDAGLQKTTQITERQSVEFRIEASNVLNHPSWYIDDQTLSSSQFGRITTTFYGSRVVQAGMYYRF
jgi:hypothetical protein